VKSDNKRVGRVGESMAALYLERKGYRIEKRNFTTRFGEIDIVCWDGKILVFVEVKTKIGHDFGEPEEMVNKDKLGRVKRMGELYLLEKQIDCPCRVDMIAIVLGQNKSIERIDHYEAVY